ncbi:MAG: DUF2059 domain-containing protein [Rhodobacteraceae bacterium]|nr:DUF2059 domain-containing protein [Paracoccaceae bacterium]
MPLSRVLPAVGLVLAVALTPLGVAPLRAEGVVTQAPSSVDPARISRLGDTMLMNDIIAVMRDEGMEYGRTLASDMFSGKAGADWDSAVALIYDPQIMRRSFDAGLAAALSAAGADLDAIEDFFGSERGQTILRLEIEARRALLDKDVEDTAKLAWEDLRSTDDARTQRILRFAEANDLVESNVMGAMNANLAFYRGLSDSGAFPDGMTEDQMLADIWGQEPEVRSETEDWLFPFLSLAYQPLSDDDLDAYIAFSETTAGKQMNAALFAAFDTVFTRISNDLGRAAGKQMQGEDI